MEQKDRIDMLGEALKCGLDDLDKHYPDHDNEWRSRFLAGYLASTIMSITQDAAHALPRHRIVINGHGNRWCETCEQWARFIP